MYSSFRKRFAAYIEGRLDDIHNWLAEHDNEFIKLQREAVEFQDALMADVTEEKRKVFMEYEERVNFQEYLMSEAVYIQGFKDGIRLAGRTK